MQLARETQARGEYLAILVIVSMPCCVGAMKPSNRHSQD